MTGNLDGLWIDLGLLIIFGGLFLIVYLLTRMK